MVLGLLSLGVGIVGIILPVLPTTPFILLTGYFLAKSSDRINDWFLSTTIYQKYLKEFTENREMKRKHKWTLLLTVDLFMLISFITIDSIYVRVLIIVLEAYKYYYFSKHINAV